MSMYRVPAPLPTGLSGNFVPQNGLFLDDAGLGAALMGQLGAAVTLNQPGTSNGCGVRTRLLARVAGHDAGGGDWLDGVWCCVRCGRLGQPHLARPHHRGHRRLGDDHLVLSGEAVRAAS